MKKIIVSTLILTGICLVVVALLVLTNEVTRERIAAAELAARQKAVRAVLVGAEGDPEKLSDEIYRGFDAEGELIGYAYITSAKGYGGDVTCVIGMSKDGKILGISVSAPDETPGLGANVTKDKFTSQFVGKNEQTYVDYEGITSATYSSEAVGECIARAYELFKATIMDSEGGVA